MQLGKGAACAAGWRERKIYALARELARPVARCWLPQGQAHAALSVAVLRANRLHELEEREPDKVLATAIDILAWGILDIGDAGEVAA
jgi:hypothetical protein